MTTESTAKRPRLEGTKLIGTHDGVFHADESLAVHLVRRLAEYQGADLVRTRDPKVLGSCDIVVDVSGIYDHDQLRYDHHQRGFFETFSSDFQTKLSSAGLVYKHYGQQVIADYIQEPVNSSTVSLLHVKLYQDFVEALDGIDNGVTEYEAVDGGEVRSKYRNRTGLSSRVGKLVPRWNEPFTSEILDARFEEASALAGKEFFQALDYLHKAWLPARSLVKSALESRLEDDQTGRIIVFKSALPWKEHLHTLEQELQIPKDQLPFYALYADESSKWRVQAVPVAPESFDSRKGLPEPWRGVRDDQLSKLADIPGCIFVHASGFIGGNATKEGALEMARKAVACV